MPSDFLLLCFSYGTVDNRRVGHFRRHVKIQQFVVLRRLFDCFADPQAKLSHELPCGCPHENIGLWSNITGSSAQDDFIFTWPTRKQFIFISVPAYFNNILKKHISFSPCSSVQINAINTKSLVLLKTQTLLIYTNHFFFFASLDCFTSNPHCLVANITVWLHKTITHPYECRRKTLLIRSSVVRSPHHEMNGAQNNFTKRVNTQRNRARPNQN